MVSQALSYDIDSMAIDESKQVKQINKKGLEVEGLASSLMMEITSPNVEDE